MPKILSTEDVGEFRERLLKSAEAAFSAHGPDGVTMRQLAQQLGCSPMTPYRYFRNRDEILAAVTASLLHRFSASLEKAFAAKGSSGEKAVAVRKAYIHFAFKHPKAYRLMFDAPHPDLAEHAELLAASQRADRIMAAPLERLAEEGLIAGDARLLGRVLWSAIHGAVLLHLAGKLSDTPKFQTVLDHTLRLIMAGASASPSSLKP